jgi:hypothetical protein
MLVERTIWERLRFIPPFKRTEIRNEMAHKMGIDSHSVLKHMQKNGWHNKFKKLYKQTLLEVTKTEELDWENPNHYLFISEITMRYIMREPTEEITENISSLGGEEGGVRV